MTSREAVARTINFEGADWLPYDFRDDYGSDIVRIYADPSPDVRPVSGVDEWGAVWENIGSSTVGEVKDFPIKEWSDFDKMTIPDVHDPKRWLHLKNAREEAGDKYLLAIGFSIYERVHFIRGLENTWMDIHCDTDNLCRLLDTLVEMNLGAVQHFAEAGADGYQMSDDWGLQDRLMISPDDWRRIWKPRYAKVFGAAHEAGMQTFMHSCGYIVDILDDLIEVGLDAIHMDQQENMTLELLDERFGGRITFFSPVDIQNTMARGNVEEIRAYCHKMYKHLGRPKGGLLPRWYKDPVGAGHTEEALIAMFSEFQKISKAHRSS